MKEFWGLNKQAILWKSIPEFLLAIFGFAQAAPSLGWSDQACFRNVHINADCAHSHMFAYSDTLSFIRVNKSRQIHTHIHTRAASQARAKLLSRPGPTLHGRRWTSWIPFRSPVYSPQPRLSRCVFCSKYIFSYVYSTVMQMWGWQMLVLTHSCI